MQVELDQNRNKWEQNYDEENYIYKKYLHKNTFATGRLCIICGCQEWRGLALKIKIKIKVILSTETC